MRSLSHPDLGSVALPDVLAAFADPVRLSLVQQMASSAGIVCGQFDALQTVSMSTVSHHLKILREAGVIRITQDGRFRRHEVRRDELEERFPGLVDALATSW